MVDKAMKELRGSALEQPHVSNTPHKSGKFARIFKEFLRVLAFFISLCAVCLISVDIARIINPDSVLNRGPVIDWLNNYYHIVPAAIFASCGFVLSLLVRTYADGSLTKHSKITTAAIILSIIALVGSSGSFAASQVFPRGIIGHQNMSIAPLNDSEKLTETVDNAFGQCESGWANINPARFPGVSYINVCASTSALFVAYDSPAQARAYDGIMAPKAAAYIQSAMGTKLPEHVYSSLSGDQWLVVGPTAGIRKLQDLWGGKLDPIEAADATRANTPPRLGQTN